MLPSRRHLIEDISRGSDVDGRPSKRVCRPSFTIVDLNRDCMLCILACLTFRDHEALSFVNRHLYQFIHMHDGLWQEVLIPDLFEMCMIPRDTTSRPSRRKVLFGLRKISLSGLVVLELPAVAFIVSALFSKQVPADFPHRGSAALESDFGHPLEFPVLEKLIVRVDSVANLTLICQNLLSKEVPLKGESGVDMDTEEGEEEEPLAPTGCVVESLPKSLQVVLFSFTPRMIDQNLKRASRKIVDLVVALKTALRRVGLSFNVSLCASCQKPVVLDNCCGLCGKLICSGCEDSDRCGVCHRVHHVEHIKPYCLLCGERFNVCLWCKQSDYEECFHCDKMYCEKHENDLTPCTLCGEYFCSDEKCIYQCNGCDEFTCYSEDCGVESCPNCERKYCRGCVLNKCFMQCEVEGCKAKMCEGCQLECTDCLASCCEWCRRTQRCCLESDEEDEEVGELAREDGREDRIVVVVGD